ncbi:MAG: RluA family pseudouridine synthase [Flavobacteriaceae bacterium]|nr:RluA family pseudouridine synthase [Flavobacteriaceae bacterium]
MNDENLLETSFHEHYSFVIDSGQEPLRIDKFLMNRIENATRNKIQLAIKAGNVYVNDVSVKSNYKVKGSDKIRILMDYPPHEKLLVAENIPINIIYEDKSIVIINKPPGIVVHPGHGNYKGTLMNGLIYHFKNLPNNKDNRPGLVHRIDKDTSGLLVIAKTEKSMINLSRQFLKKKSKRDYYALVWGDVNNDKGTIISNIARNPKNRLQMLAYEDEGIGKKAITHYEVLERFRYVTLVKCQLETGRTHQIRVHMKYMGHTLFNDERYGGNVILKGTIFSKYRQFVENCFKSLPRQALHAKTLGFKHPESNDWVEFNSILPEDMQITINKWRKYCRHKKKE